MTYAIVASGNTSAGGNSVQVLSFSLTTHGIGNFIVAGVRTFNNTTLATGLSSSNVTWTTLGAPFSGTDAGGALASFQLFLGAVTAASTATVTITWAAGTHTDDGFACQEFTTTTGIPVLDQVVLLNSAAGTNTWPSIPAAGAGECYFGYDVDTTSASNGSTSGFTYEADAGFNSYVFNPNCSSGTVAGPTFNDITHSVGLMALVMPGSTPVSQAPAPRTGPGRRTPMAFRQKALWPQPVVVPALKAEADEAGSAFSGVLLRLVLLTGQSSVPIGNTATNNAAPLYQLSLAASQSGSMVFGAMVDNRASVGLGTLLASTSALDNIQDSPFGASFASWQSASATTALGAATFGASADPGASASRQWAGLEIYSGTGLAVAATSSGYAGSAAAGSGNPGGWSVGTQVPYIGNSLLVAIVAAQGSGGGTISFGVSGSGLAWTEQAHIATTANGYAGVWTATVGDQPGGGQAQLIHERQSVTVQAAAAGASLGR